MDIQFFVSSLVSQPPGEPNSVELELDVGGDPAALFEALLSIFIAMIKQWYPTPIELSTVTKEDMTRCVEYFASFGIQLAFEVQEMPRVLRINNKEYETQERLQDMKFQMTSSNKLYTLRFNFL